MTLRSGNNTQQQQQQGRPARPTPLSRSTTATSSSSPARPSLLAGLSLSSGPSSPAYSSPPRPTTSSSPSGLSAPGVAISSFIPPRPRRLWKVNDTSLRPVPFFYPPLDPKCSVFISDAPPSVVAVRIAECLRKRSISVEYDEEAITAQCMTIDRCHFVVHMWQGSTVSAPGSSSNHSMNNNRSRSTGAVGGAGDVSCSGSVGSILDSTADPHLTLNQHNNRSSSLPLPPPPTKVDFSHGLIVECLRVRGDVMTFHHNCRAILQAALSHCTGEDDRESFQLTPLDFQKRNPSELLSPAAKRQRANNDNHSNAANNNHLHQPQQQPVASSLTKALEALEHVMHLLKKDRLEPQRLAMETLVALTDPYSSGMDVAIHCSLAVLGVPMTGAIGGKDEDENGLYSKDSMIGIFMSDPETLQQFHKEWIVHLIQDRVLPQEQQHQSSTNSKKKKNSESGGGLNDSGILSSLSCTSSFLGLRESAAERADRERSQANQNSMLLREASLTEFNMVDTTTKNNKNKKNKDQNNQHSHHNQYQCDEYHGGILRSLSLRAFTNALECISSAAARPVATNKTNLLTTILQIPAAHLTRQKFLSTLLDDLSGVSRPPMIVRGTRLASIHESVLALKCLRLLGQHSTVALEFILTDTVLAMIEKLRSTGKSTHMELAQEADLIYNTLTEEARSC